MSRKKTRQARTERMKAAREARAQVQNDGAQAQLGAQASINVLQEMWNDDGCEATESAIQAGACIAVVSRDLAHSPGWAAIEKAGLRKPEEIRFVNNLKAAADEFVASGGRPDVAFTLFTEVTHGLAHRIGDEMDNRPQAPEAPKSETPKHSKDVVNVQALTKAWVAKSKDPNATPEEREQAKKLVEDYGIGDTSLLQ